VFWKIGWVLLAAGFLFVNGCGGGGSSGGAGGCPNPTAPVLLSVIQFVGKDQAGTNTTNLLWSDVYHDAGTPGDVTDDTIVEDAVSVTIENRPRDPTLTSSSVFTDFRFTRYRVEFKRTDGGTEVPTPFDGTMNLYVPSGQQVSIPIVLVRADQKVQKPLSHLQRFSPTGGVEPGTGLFEIHTTATVIFYGETVANQQSCTSGSLTVNFTDWGNSK
jgi:hypothetical protein